MIDEDSPRGCERVAAIALEVAQAAHLPPELESIVSMASALDEQLTALPLQYKEIDAVFDELEELAPRRGFPADLVGHLRQFRVDGLGPSRRWARLPVQADVAHHVLRFLGSQREYENADIEKLAASDPVLAGAVIRVANSAIYSPQSRISRLRAAISYMGAPAAREVMLAAAVRPLYASAGSLRLWRHSLQMAQLCSALGGQSGLVESESGLLIGLVHDIGTLAIKTLPGTEIPRYGRLIGRGCPPTYVEYLLFGRDHGEIGAGILAQWNFPESMIEAVRFHHQSERSQSPIASLVYLAEFWSGLEEDLPSFVRIQECAARTGISMELLATAPGRTEVLKLLESVT